MKRFCATCLLWFALANTVGGMLAGCGQKNDLYLPDDADTREQRQ